MSTRGLSEKLERALTRRKVAPNEVFRRNSKTPGQPPYKKTASEIAKEYIQNMEDSVKKSPPSSEPSIRRRGALFRKFLDESEQQSS